MAIKMTLAEVKAADPKGFVEAVVATIGAVDSDGDVLVPGALGRQTVVALPAHDWSHVPLGKGLMYEQGREVIAEIKFNLNIDAARNWFEAIRFDVEHPPARQEWSWGYSVLEGGSKTGDFQGRQVRYLTPLPDGSPGVDLHEVSPVVRAASIGTRTLAAKGDDVADVADLAAIRDRVVEQSAHDEATVIYAQVLLRAEWDRFRQLIEDGS